MSAPVLQWQIVTPTPDVLLAFYRDLFGWRATDANALGYRQVDTGRGGLPGGVWPAPPGASTFVQLFVGVADVERSVAKAVELGATVLVPPTTLPDGDTMAVLSDPSGLPLGLMRHRAVSPNDAEE
jgi:predicted enzyme related to lactoylglutathione lyase